MSRGFGEVAAIQELLPDWSAVVVGLLTQLGDVWFLFVLFGVIYWRRPQLHEELLLVVGTATIGTGLLQSLKYRFALPRPNHVLLDPDLVPAAIRPLYEATAFASGFGFPSGHATATTLVYVGLAAVLPVGTRKQRYGGAAILVVVVSFTRVALGLHFLVDVVAGAALGGLLVALTVGGIRPAVEDSLTVVFSLGVLSTALFLVESAGSVESQLAVGGALGLLGGWQVAVLSAFPDSDDRLAGVSPTVRRGIVAVVFLFLVAALASAPVTGREVALGALAGLGAAVVVQQSTVRASASDRNGYSGQ